jgi:hypothetical protein
MSSTVDDVKRRNGGNKLVSALASELSKIVIERKVLGISTSSGYGQGNSQDSISTNLLFAPAPLVLGSINLFNHLFIDLDLLGNVNTLESRAE